MKIACPICKRLLPVKQEEFPVTCCGVRHASPEAMEAYKPTPEQRQMPERTPRAVAIGSGPGTELKKLLAFLRLKVTTGCKCNEHIATMNREGPAWCRANLETIIDWIEAEHAARKLKIPFSRFVAGRVVLLAVKRAEKVVAVTAKII